MVKKRHENQFKLNLDINKAYHECYEAFKNENTRIFYIDLRKAKDKNLINKIKDFCDFVFLRSLYEINSEMLENKKFYMLFGIVGLENYLKKLSDKEASECIDFLIEFHNSHLGKIFLMEGSTKLINEFTNRNCRLNQVTIPEDAEKDDFNQIIMNIKRNNNNIKSLNRENLETLFNIVGANEKLIQKFADKFTSFPHEDGFIYNDHYFKSILIFIKKVKSKRFFMTNL